MTAGHGLLADRGGVLEVLAAELPVAQQAVAAPVEEELGLVKVTALAGGAVELDERHLNLRVTADGDLAVRPEGLADVVGVAQGDAHDDVVAEAGTQAGDGCLNEVARAVQLVPHGEVGVAVLDPRLVIAGVEVPVLVLDGLDQGAQALDLCLQSSVPGAADLPGHGLDELVDV